MTSRPTRRSLGTTLGASLIALAFGIGPALAQSAPGTTYEEILAGARAEGKLSAWIVAPRGPEAQQALIDAFNDRFGLETVVEWVPNNPIQASTRLMAEAQSDAVSVDVIGGGAAEEVATLMREGLLKPWDWSVLNEALPGLAALREIELPELAGMALPYQKISYGIAWNPSLIDEAEVPATLADLTDPKWEGRFAVNAFFLAPLEVVSYETGNEAALDLAQKLVANRPVFEKGSPSVARAVSTGVVPLGVTIDPVVFTMQRMGEPIEYRMFADVMPVSTVYLYVPENAPNPNTARLFAAWLASEGSPIGDPFEPMVNPVDPEAELNRMIAAQAEATGARVAAVASLSQLEASAALRDPLAALVAGQ